MCGIVGQFGAPDVRALEAMAEAVKRRGPDVGPTSAAAHGFACSVCRLAITEPQLGEQPWIDESGDLIVCLNGELYNRHAVYEILAARGRRPRHRGECEIIGTGYRELGLSIFGLLEGMFAIALFDVRNRQLLLVRDRTGIKPLYYTVSQGTVWYASEIKAFFAAGLKFDALDEYYLTHRHVFGFGPLRHTLFRDIRPVRPGSLIVFGNASTKEFFYAAPLGAESAGVGTDVSLEVREAVENAVLAQIPDELPFVVFLSGGVDSSILSSLALKSHGARAVVLTLRDPVETADLVAARKTAEFLGVPLVEVAVQSPSSQDVLAYLSAREEFDLLSYYWFRLSRAAAHHAKVGLCGQGADEVFCGYPFHRDIDSALRKFEARWLRMKRWVSIDIAHAIEGRITELRSSNTLEAFYRFFLADQLTWFQLEPLDHCSMAHGIELRVPFLAERIIRLAMRLPLEDLYAGEKRLLREAFRATNLPTIDRPKQFAGRWTIPATHAALTALLESRAPRMLSPTYQVRRFVSDPVDALCLEALLIVLTEFSRTPPTTGDCEAVWREAALKTQTLR